MSKLVFFDPVQTAIEQVEARMRSQSDGVTQPELTAAFEHLLSSGGKRVRVAVTLLVGGALNADHERLVTLAAAIEMLHTATLVHDDLIDGALMRRGMPTLNARWTPAATVLTGDFIFAQAAKLSAETGSVAVMRLFSETLAVIVGGEIRQLFGRRGSASRTDYDQRIYAKTASLFETSALAPALLSEADEETLQATRRYGYEIGMAFQIIDDVLDFTGEQAKVGKPVANDLRQGLITLPTLYYLEKHPQDENLQKLLAGARSDQINFDVLLAAIRQSGAIDLAVNEAQQYVERAVVALSGLPAGLQRDSLEELARFIARRNL